MKNLNVYSRKILIDIALIHDLLNFIVSHFGLSKLWLIFNVWLPGWRINLLIAQYHIFHYFAKILHDPIINIAYIFETYKVSLNELQNELLKRIDYTRCRLSGLGNSGSLYTSTDKSGPFVTSDEESEYAAQRIQDFFINTVDSLVHLASKK